MKRDYAVFRGRFVFGSRESFRGFRVREGVQAVRAKSQGAMLNLACLGVFPAAASHNFLKSTAQA